MEPKVLKIKGLLMLTKRYISFLGLLLFLLLFTCDNKSETSISQITDVQLSETSLKAIQKENIIPEKKKRSKVTFIELGSKKCIPCKKMVPVMKAIEEEYGDLVNVIFYDVWTAQGKPFAKQYKIRLIPTQVFLDENGQEFFRHEGFFSKNEIDKIFVQKGVE